MSLNFEELPEHGEVHRTDTGQVREADRYLLYLMEHLSEEYGWVAMLDILWQKVRSYPSGRRYARFLIDKWDNHGKLGQRHDTVSANPASGSGSAGTRPHSSG